MRLEPERRRGRHRARSRSMRSPTRRTTVSGWARASRARSSGRAARRSSARRSRGGRSRSGRRSRPVAGRLPARYVIHGAVMGQDLRTSADLVRRTTESCLSVADELGLRLARAPGLRDWCRRLPARGVRPDHGRRRRARTSRDSLERGRPLRLRAGGGAGFPRGARPARATRPRLATWRASRGLICAGGEATRLGELTRVANKHLLPVGRWPMIYYPLQLLQLAGHQRGADRHRPGPCRPADRPARRRQARRPRRRRAALRARPHLQGADPCRVGSPRSSGWPRASRRAGGSSSASATTSSSTRRSAAIREFAGGRRRGADLREGGARPRALRRRRLRRGAARRRRGREGRGRRHAATTSPPTRDAVVGLYCYDAACLRRHSRPRAVVPRRARDHGRQPRVRGARDVSRPCAGSSGWWHDAGTHEALAEIGALVERTGANKSA